MDLQTFLWKYKMTSAELSRKVGCAYSSMTAYVRRQRKPQLAMAEKIEYCTRGEVTAAELMTGRYTTDYKEDFIKAPMKPREDRIDFPRETVVSNSKICL